MPCEFVTIAREDALSATGQARVKMGTVTLALFKFGDSICAMEDQCPHRGAALGEGIVEDGIVSCPLHGWRFRLGSGECLDAPGKFARTFPVRVVDGQIQIRLGD